MPFQLRAPVPAVGLHQLYSLFRDGCPFRETADLVTQFSRFTQEGKGDIFDTVVVIG